MTCEEAIKELEELKAAYDIPAKSAKNETFRIEFENAAKAVSFALAALCGPTREQVKKACRGEWKGIGADKRGRHGMHDCLRCEKCNPYKSEFCPHCGSPMTDEAVDILHKRLGALKDGSTD